MGLRTKLIIFFSLVSIAPLLIFGIFIYRTIYNESILSASNKLANIASQSEQKINSYFQKVREDIANFTENSDLSDMIGTGNNFSSETRLSMEKYFRAFISQSSLITDISIVDTKGNFISSTKNYTFGEKYPYKTTLSFSSELEQIDLVQTDSTDTTATKLIFLSPMLIDGVLKGTYVSETNTSIVASIAGSYTELGNTGEIVIGKQLDENNLVYIFPLRFDSEAAFKREVALTDSKVGLVNAMKRLENVYTTNIVDYNNNQVVVATRYIDLANWGMVVKMNKSEILIPISNYLRNLLVYFLFIIPTIVVVSYFIANSITKPIVELTLLAQKISDGNYSQKIGAITNDEIGKLSEVFNLMTTRLTDSYGALEQKVAERTKELEVAKASLETAKNSLEADVAKRTEELEKAKNGLEAEVAKRTAELNVKLEENIKMNKYMVGRENKMVELKKKLQEAGIS